MSHKGRMISQDCARDPHLNALSLEAELLYLLTLPHLDRDGLIDGDPTLLAATVAPRRPELRDQAGRLINEWLEQNLVLRYDWKDGPILFFKGFRRHNPTLVYDRDPASRFPPPPGFFRGEYGLIPANPDAAHSMAEAFDSRTNYAKELALHAANTPYPEPDEPENYPRARLRQQRRGATGKPAASMQQAGDINATDRPVGGFSPVGDPLGAEVALMQHSCRMDATTDDDDDDAIYTSSSSSSVVAVPSKGGSGGKRHSNATSAVGVVAAPPRPTPPPATRHPPPATSHQPPAISHQPSASHPLPPTPCANSPRRSPATSRNGPAAPGSSTAWTAIS